MPERIGRIVRIQIQRAPLRRSGAYDPTPLLTVDRSMVSARGVLGWAEGGWMLDVHHADHPDVRGRGLRGLSIGFTSHYEAMRRRFGDVPLGVAGENLVVETDRRWEVAEMAAGVAIRTSGSAAELVLGTARPAEPCLEFTSFLLGLPERAARSDVDAELEFLGGGLRGFLVDAGRIRSPQPVAVGDEVWAPS